jgi:hypothetical protein
MSSTACIKWIKIGSPSFKPTLIVGLLFASSQVNCTNPCSASLIFLALDLVIGPSGTCKGSLRLGPPWFPSNLPQCVVKFNHETILGFFLTFLVSLVLTTYSWSLAYLVSLYDDMLLIIWSDDTSLIFNPLGQTFGSFN